MRMRQILPWALAAVLYSQTPAPAPRTMADAEKREAELEKSPDDVSTRLQLMTFYRTQQSSDSAKKARSGHVVWMIEHRPENMVLSQPAGTIDPSDNASVAVCDTAWRKQIAAGALSADALANAAGFFKAVDQAYARQLVDDGLKQYPTNTRLADVKGNLLAYTILGVKKLDQYGRATSFDDTAAKSDDSARARRELDTATSAHELAAAGQALVQQLYPLNSHNMAKQFQEAGDLAVKYDQRAIELEPENASWKSHLMTAWQSIATYKKSPGEKIELLEKAIVLAPGSAQRGYVLTELADQYFIAGKIDKASEAAHELVNDAGSQSDWNYGNRVHKGNILLGRIALQQGDVKDAKRYLLEAGRTTGSPQLNSFGPDWKLATDLLGKGERDAVLAYIDSCRSFWKSGTARLDSWANTIRSGGVANFNGPAEMPRAQFLGKPAPEFRLADLTGNNVTLI
jgi:hypothetical protein